jgi:hypothetical protein
MCTPIRSLVEFSKTAARQHEQEIYKFPTDVSAKLSFPLPDFPTMHGPCWPLPDFRGPDPPFLAVHISQTRPKLSTLWRQPGESRQSCPGLCPLLLPPTTLSLAPKQMTSSVGPTPISRQAPQAQAEGAAAGADAGLWLLWHRSGFCEVSAAAFKSGEPQPFSEVPATHQLYP